METNEDLRQQLMSTARAFRFDQSRLDSTTIASAGRKRRRRGRLLGSAVVVAALAATVAVTQRGGSPASVVAVGSGEVYLDVADTPDGLVLRRSSVFTSSPSLSYFSAFYGDGSSRRIVVITALRDGLEASAASPRAVTTNSGLWMPWYPQSGVEVDVATVGLSQQETEALFDRVGVDPTRGPMAYGLVSLPPGFRKIGDENDTAMSGGVLNVYAKLQANLNDPRSPQPRIDVTIGHASDTYREIDRIIFDERTTVSIRGHEADVVTHRSNNDHGEIVTVSWFEQPGLLVNITAYNTATDNAVSFARSLQPVTLEVWKAHQSSARG
jgi:hypothetical protein